MDDAGWLTTFALLLIELLALLFVVSATMALAVRRVGLPRLQRWLGGSALTAALKGVTVGFAIPFCTYSAIPALVGMIDARVRTATLAGFTLTAPLLDPVVVAVLWLLFGWQATIAYVAVTVVTIVTLALVADRTGVERLLRRQPLRVATPSIAAPNDATSPQAPIPASCVPDPFTSTQPWISTAAELRAAGVYARGLVRGLAVPMTLAVAVAAGIVGLVPEQAIARLAGPDNPLAVPAAALVGVPFYVSTEAFLPIASALHTSGMGVGAVFALVITASGVNVPELALLGRMMRPRLLGAYLASIIGVALAAGYLVPVLL